MASNLFQPLFQPLFRPVFDSATRGRAGAATWTPASISAPLWLDVSDLSTMKQERTGASATTPSVVDGGVGSLFNKGTFGFWSVAASDAARPVLRTGGSIEFDGSNDLLTLALQASAVTLPDGAAHSEAGKGFTCTGLVKDLTDDTWWVGNHGKKNETTQGSESFESSVVHLSEDFSTILGEITVTSLGETPNTVQGVALDTAAGNLYFMNGSTILKVSKLGALLATLTPGFSINGLAYDSIADRLFGITTAGSIYAINKSTGTASLHGSIGGALSADHLCFDPTYGAAGALFVTDGANGSYSSITKYDISSASVVAAWVLRANAIEGIWADADGFVIADDAYYHNVGALNVIRTFALDKDDAPSSTRITVAGVAKSAATPSGTVALVCGGDPVGNYGLGLYFTATANQLRLILRTAGLANSVVNWTVPSATTKFAFRLEIDTVAKTAALYINGSLISSQSFTNGAGKVPLYTWTLGGAIEATGETRQSASSIWQFLATYDFDHRAQIDAFLATK